MLKKLTRYLLSKNKDIEDEIVESRLKDYLDKKVVSVNVNEFMQPEKGGERIYLQDVILYQSVISHSIIETEKIMVVGSQCVLSGNIVNLKKDESA